MSRVFFSFFNNIEINGMNKLIVLVRPWSKTRFNGTHFSCPFSTFSLCPHIDFYQFHLHTVRFSHAGQFVLFHKKSISVQLSKIVSLTLESSPTVVQIQYSLTFCYQCHISHINI